MAEIRRILHERPRPEPDEVRERLRREMLKISVPETRGIVKFLTTDVDARELFLIFGWEIFQWDEAPGEVALAGESAGGPQWLVIGGLGHVVRLEEGDWRLTACEKYTPAGSLAPAESVRRRCRRCEAAL